MHKLLHVGVLSTFVLAVSACATVETKAIGPTQSPIQGQTYYLPQAQFQLRIVESGGAVQVVLTGPSMGADPSAQLVSRPRRSALADNNVTITVDPVSNLLSKVEVTSTGRATEIVAGATRSLGLLQAGVESQGRVLFDAQFGIREIDESVSRANAALTAYLHRACGPAARNRARAGGAAADNNEALKICNDLEAAGLTEASAPGFIAISVDSLANPGQLRSPAARDFSACTRGICYRPLIPARLIVTVGALYSEARRILVPNEQQLAHIDLWSGVFAEQKYELNFTAGVLTSYRQDAVSELVGLVSLPGNIVGGLLGGVAEGLGLRQTALQAETNYLNAIATNAQAQRAAAAACRTLPAACSPAGFEVIRVPIGASSDEGRAEDSGGGADSGGQSGQDG